MKWFRWVVSISCLGLVLTSGCGAPSVSDASVDAAADVTVPRDAGAADAMDRPDTSDASLGPVDAGVRDAGPADTGPPDTGPTDAGPVCGNGAVEAGELCDDGNTQEGDACDTNCTPPACGNGIVDPGELCLGAPMDFATAAGSTAIAIADYDGDSFLDLAVANASAIDVSVLSNDGHGAFAAARSYPTGTTPVSIATLDANRDAHPDLVVATNTGILGQGFLGYLANQGDGTFAAVRPFGAGINSQHVTTGDLNRDGLPDAIVSNYGDNAISLFFGSEASVFAPAVSTRVNGASSAVITDLNGDGRPDIAAAATTFSTLFVFLGDGAGGLGTPTMPYTSSAPGVVRAGDLDDDGDTDVVVANPFHVWPSVMRNDGTGALQVTTPGFGLAQSAVVIADMDADGWNDLVLAAPSANGVYVMTNDRTGGFESPVSFVSAAGPADVGVADLDDDGALDLAVPCSGAGAVRVWLSEP